MCDNRSNRPAEILLLPRLSSVLLAMLLCGPAFAAAPPANDNCGSAAIVAGSAPTPPYSSSVDATDATLDATDPQLTCNSNDGTQTVWWVYTPDASGEVDISTIGSTTAAGGELDTAHGVFTGSCGVLVEVACADVGLNDHLNMEVEAGTTYYIKVGQYAGGSAAGTVFLNVDEPQFQPGLKVIESSLNGTSAPLSEILAAAAPEVLAAARAGNGLESVYEVPNLMKSDGGASKPEANIVGSLIPDVDPLTKWRGPATLLGVYDGGVNDDNWDVLGTLIAPPDTVGDVGRDNYVQMYNLLTEIFDKEGNTVLGPFPTSAVFNGLFLQSWCAHSNDGDPIVLYDEETDRWLISQFLLTYQDGLCVAISTTGDPMGTYNVYEFDFTGYGFPDYPKYGFATDSVALMVNLFYPFQGSALGAIDKEEMLAGDPATLVLFTGGLDAQLGWGWVPGDNDGPVFDNTVPTFFTTLGGSGDTIFVAEVTPDWDTPEDTGLGFQAIPVAPWDSDLCNVSRERCIDQPGSGTTVGGNPDFLPASTQVIAWLEAIADRMMHRAQTRDFGKRKQAILSHTVDVDGTGKAGVRWYELWNDRDRGWKLKKQETFSPDGDHRWMGSIAMTADGDTCLGYSISSETTYPSIGITGRKGTANHMNIKEVVAYDGNVTGGVQRGVARWGDYSAMSVDPVDDTCWYTQEYPRPNQAVSPSRQLPYGEFFGWGTKIIHYDTN